MPHRPSQDRVRSYVRRSTGLTQLERDEIIPALALRSYHLPGYSYWGDWCQYIGNNHPIFGLCCHHRLHPIGVRMRLVNLVGSITFGLAVTNIIWIWLIFNEFDQDQAVFTLTMNGWQQENATTEPTSSSDLIAGGQIAITQGMLLLWTVGGGLHAVFDNTIWFITACVCCLPGQSLEHLQHYKKYINYFVVMTVVLCTAVATFAVVLRASLVDSSTQIDPNENVDLSDVEIRQARDVSAYDFLVSYGIELSLAFLFYYPLVGTILFSGILGCGSIPLLGGRPYEVKQEQKKRARRSADRRNSLTEHSASNSHV